MTAKPKAKRCVNTQARIRPESPGVEGQRPALPFAKPLMAASLKLEEILHLRASGTAPSSSLAILVLLADPVNAVLARGPASRKWVCEIAFFFHAQECRNTVTSLVRRAYLCTYPCASVNKRMGSTCARSSLNSEPALPVLACRLALAGGTPYGHPARDTVRIERRQSRRGILPRSRRLEAASTLGTFAEVVPPSEGDGAPKAQSHTSLGQRPREVAIPGRWPGLV